MLLIQIMSYGIHHMIEVVRALAALGADSAGWRLATGSSLQQSFKCPGFVLPSWLCLCCGKIQIDVWSFHEVEVRLELYRLIMVCRYRIHKRSPCSSGVFRQFCALSPGSWHLQGNNFSDFIDALMTLLQIFSFLVMNGLALGWSNK